MACRVATSPNSAVFYRTGRLEQDERLLRRSVGGTIICPQRAQKKGLGGGGVLGLARRRGRTGGSGLLRGEWDGSYAASGGAGTFLGALLA